MATKDKYMAALGLASHSKGECYACGGMVDTYGKAFGGEVPDSSSHKSLDEFTNAIDEANAPDEDDGPPLDMDEPEDDEDTHKAKFVSAIMKRRSK